MDLQICPLLVTPSELGTTGVHPSHEVAGTFLEGRRQPLSEDTPTHLCIRENRTETKRTNGEIVTLSTDVVHSLKHFRLRLSTGSVKQ